MSDERDDGGPAFPTTKPLDGWGDPNRGMSLRDWFAGQALIGLLSATSHPKSTGPSQEPAEVYALNAYILADAMLAERTKP